MEHITQISRLKVKTSGKTKLCPFCGKQMEDKSIEHNGVLREHFMCYCPGFLDAIEKRAEEDFRREMDEIRQRNRGEYINRLIAKSDVPAKYSHMTFADYKTATDKQRQAVRTAYDYVRNFSDNLQSGKGLYIAGNFGTGKSMLTSIMAMELLKAKYKVKYSTAYNLLRTIRKRTITQGESEEAVLDDFATCDLLVIDDLGKEKATEYSTATISTIINDRYEAELPIIITSNYGLRALENKLTPPGNDGSTARSVISRLSEVTDTLVFDWEDKRKNG